MLNLMEKGDDSSTEGLKLFNLSVVPAVERRTEKGKKTQTKTICLPSV